MSLFIGGYIPASFDSCVRDGGRVRTKVISGGRYIHICYKDGKSYTGEVRTVKEQGERVKK